MFSYRQLDVLTRGAVGDKLDFEYLSHPRGEPRQRIDRWTARAVFDAADVGLPDARLFGKLLLRHFAFQTRADDGADRLLLRAQLFIFRRKFGVFQLFFQIILQLTHHDASVSNKILSARLYNIP